MARDGARMANLHPLIGSALLALSLHAQAQRLDDAEVRITYGELKQLLARSEPTPIAPPKPPDPELLSARLRFLMEQGRPIMHATFRTLGFGEQSALVPLISGDVTLQSQTPEDATIITEDDALCYASNKTGTHTLQLGLLPIHSSDGFSFTIPPCPSMIFETGELSAGQSVVLKCGGREETLGAGQMRPLPSKGGPIHIRLLDSRETREALSPPEHSAWAWQHQAVVIPTDGDLVYQINARASAANGSGVEAQLPLPSDAQDVTVYGDDLVSHVKVRGNNRALGLSLTWKTRGILDRQLTISYRMPLRPLDRTWKLQAPGNGETRTRFIIASSPLLDYAAEGLSGPLSPQGLPAALAKSLQGASCHQLEAGPTTDLTVTPIPVAATEEGVVKQSQWTVKIEPDGSMLASGILAVEHSGTLGFILDTPPDMKLLSCELEGKPVSPIDLGAGKIKIALPARGPVSQLACSFTRTSAALDPVEGTFKLSLPRTPLFLHSLLWQIDLPHGYQAETSGNLTRVAINGEPSSRISLRKNLCRDERPEIQVFYQRSNLN